MKALIALSVFVFLASCTKRDDKGGAAGDETQTDTTETSAGSGSKTPADENYHSKNDKDVKKDDSTNPSNEGTPGDSPDNATPGGSSDQGSDSAADTDSDGVTDDKDVCPGEDDALQVTRYKLVDADNDTYADAALSAKVCPSNTEYTLTQAQAVVNDCNGSDATKWQMLSYSHRDADGDGHSVPSSGSICTGSVLPAGYLTAAIGTTDCDDGNSSYHSIATYYAYEPDPVTADRFSRISETTCIPSDGFGGINAFKEYRLVPDVISDSNLYILNGFHEYEGKVYFGAANDASGLELWASDGSPEGTTLIKDIAPGAGHSSPANFVSVAGKLYFTADDGTGVHLWKTDGTDEGTVKVKAVTPTLLTAANGLLYFVASSVANGLELWKCDGTENGTVMVKDIRPSFASSSPTSLTDVNGTLFFLATDGTGDKDLWKSDGSEAGTVKVKDLSAPAIADLTAVGDTLFFTARNNDYGRELWKSDGTEAGTIMVKDIRVGNSDGLVDSGSSYFENFGGMLYFLADDGTSGKELWKSDGTESGTVMVKDIRPGFNGSVPSNLTAANGTLFFTADDGSMGTELWKSDGTAAGTTLVKDIKSGGSITLAAPVAVGSVLYFLYDDGTHGNELWKSDGTAAGTFLVKDLAAGSSNPSLVSAFGNQLVFLATTSAGDFMHITPKVLP